MHLPTPTVSVESTEDLDLLDILVVVAEHIKLLVIGPLLVGLSALLIGQWLPRSFESVAILDAEKAGISLAPSVIVSLASSANLQEAVALDLGIAKDASKAARLAKMSQLVFANIGRQDKLITLRTVGRSPEQAQQLNAAVWKHLLPLTAPRGSERLRLEALLSTEKNRMTEGSKLEQITAQRLQNGHVTDDLARLYGELLTTNSNRMRAVATLQAQLEGLTTDDLVQTPTLPEKAQKPKPTFIAIMAALASGILLLIAVFVRHAWKSAKQQPKQAEKIARLRAAFRGKR